MAAYDEESLKSTPNYVHPATVVEKFLLLLDEFVRH